MSKVKYKVEHTLFSFQPAEDSDYEIWEEMDIGKKVTKYTDWFRNHHVNPKKYNFKKYINQPATYHNNQQGRVTVQIFDRKVDTLFRLAWL